MLCVVPLHLWCELQLQNVENAISHMHSYMFCMRVRCVYIRILYTHTHANTFTCSVVKLSTCEKHGRGWGVRGKVKDTLIQSDSSTCADFPNSDFRGNVKPGYMWCWLGIHVTYLMFFVAIWSVTYYTHRGAAWALIEITPILQQNSSKSPLISLKQRWWQTRSILKLFRCPWWQQWCVELFKHSISFLWFSVVMWRCWHYCPLKDVPNQLFKWTQDLCGSSLSYTYCRVNINYNSGLRGQYCVL